MKNLFLVLGAVTILSTFTSCETEGNDPITGPDMTQQNQSHDYEFGASDFNGNTAYIYANYNSETGVATFNHTRNGGEGTVLLPGDYVLTSGGFIQAQYQIAGPQSNPEDFYVVVTIGEYGVAESYYTDNFPASLPVFTGDFIDEVICTSTYETEDAFYFLLEKSDNESLSYIAYDQLGLFPILVNSNDGEAPLYGPNYVNDANERYKMQSIFDADPSTASQLITIYTNGNDYPTVPNGFFSLDAACN